MEIQVTNIRGYSDRMIIDDAGFIPSPDVCIICGDELDADALTEAVRTDDGIECAECTAEANAEGFDIFQFIE